MIGRRPDRRADVQAVIRFVRMGPQRLAVRWTHPDDAVAREHDELRLAIYVDQNRRGRRTLAAAAFPHEPAGPLVERGYGLVRTAERHDNRSVVGERTAGIAAVGRWRAVLLDEIVRPEKLAGRFVEREELAARARRVDPRADDERRCVGASAL